MAGTSYLTTFLMEYVEDCIALNEQCTVTGPRIVFAIVRPMSFAFSLYSSSTRLLTARITTSSAARG